MATRLKQVIPSKALGLAGRLVRAELLSQESADQYNRNAREQGLSLFKYLLKENIFDSVMLAEQASLEFGLPLIDITSMHEESMPLDLVDPEHMSQRHAVPLFLRGTRLFVGISDPANTAALNDLRFASGRTTEPVLVDDEELTRFINNKLDAATGLGAEMDALNSNEEYELELGAEEPDGATEVDAVDDTPIVRFVNKVLLDAIKQGASDIHFEPYESEYRVRFRTDGVLRAVASPPKNLAPRLSARLKVMSRMDISERRIPQDGRIQIKLSNRRAVDFRVNTLPTMFGEKIVLRILDPASAKVGVEALGYDEDQQTLFMEALGRPQGMILATGPTGSGKTVSLYTGLQILNEPERNISTAEDPVEIHIDGINQVLVNPKVGLNFAEALRSFLRQDPDVIMVGEIRDLETAEIAIKAAQTGHLVLSTVHTNSATETVTRLLNMGVPAFNIAASVSLIIAQRLARRLCTDCAVPETSVPEEALLELGFTAQQLKTATIKAPVGCKNCREGYRGRIGIYEVVKINKDLSRVIMDGGSSMDLDVAARAAGFNDLRRSALKKCAEGLISLQEVTRVTTD